MKKLLFGCLALAWTSIAPAQTEIEKVQIIDLKEDTTQVTTISDIIAMQEVVSKSNSTGAHFSKVWGRKSYFNLGYNYSGSMKPKGDIPMRDQYLTENIPSGVKIPDVVPEFKTDWGVMLQLGHSYTLHKDAIANIVQINLDYTFIDLNMNHYKGEDYAKYYDASEFSKDKGLPWAADKYDLSYGMNLGPSITLAPFTMLDIRPLHYLKFNVYYHIGYNIGFLLMDQKEENKKGMSFDYLAWGHGLSQSFGFNISWKSIGIGWETRTYNPTMKRLTGESSDTKYKFKNSSNRIYLTIRY